VQAYVAACRLATVDGDVRVSASIRGPAAALPSVVAACMHSSDHVRLLTQRQHLSLHTIIYRHHAVHWPTPGEQCSNYAANHSPADRCSADTPSHIGIVPACCLTVLMCCTGLTPIKLFLDERNVRAWPGGVGDCKVGSNYAPTILPQITAQQTHGTPQVSSPDGKFCPSQDYWSRA